MSQKECSPLEVDEYISQQTPKVQKVLQSIRTAVKEAVPDACEEINSNIPAVRLAEHLLIYYAADEEVPGYSMATPKISDLNDERVTKDNPSDPAAYPYDQPITYDFIRRFM